MVAAGGRITAEIWSVATEGRPAAGGWAAY